MRKYIVLISLLIFSYFICFPAFVVFAIERIDTDLSVEEVEQTAFGIVSKVSIAEVVVGEVDYENNTTQEVSYAVDSNTELRNVNTIQEIAVGDDVNISYVINDDKKIAKIISVEKITE